MKAVSLGRAPDNDLVLNDEKVSRYHARIFYRSGSWYLADMQSTHGTTVNGKSVQGQVKLRDYDEIELSDSKLIFDGSNLLSKSGRSLLSLSKPFAADEKKPRKKSSRSRRLIRLGLAAAAILLLVTGGIIMVLVEDSPVPGGSGEQEEFIYQGTIEYDGGRYTGELKDGIPHGKGTLNYQPAGRSLASQDQMSRTRRLEKFEGQWQDGVRHGYGREVYTDGYVREGYWEAGRFTGSAGN